jgi:hypothetical protein
MTTLSFDELCAEIPELQALRARVEAERLTDLDFLHQIAWPLGKKVGPFSDHAIAQPQKEYRDIYHAHAMAHAALRRLNRKRTD